MAPLQNLSQLPSRHHEGQTFLFILSVMLYRPSGDKFDTKPSIPHDVRKSQGSLGPTRSDTKNSGAPTSFHCPISMELMADPVMIATGHTYDR